MSALEHVHDLKSSCEDKMLATSNVTNGGLLVANSLKKT